MSWVWFCSGFIIIFSGFAVFKAVRTRIIAGRSGIVKICVNWVSLILQLATCGLFLFFGFGRLNDAEKYLRSARSYEVLVDTWDKINGSGYQQAAIKTDTVSPEKIANIRSAIESYKRSGKALKAYSLFLFTLSFSDLVLASAAFWYITEAGVMIGGFKTPEPIYAVLNGNKIDINYTAQLVNVKKLQSFKATPKNLEVFGRFMVQSCPQNVQYPQYPQITQYPQNVQYPQNPQIPQYPQNVQYPQNPQIPQVQQYPQIQQNPQYPQNPQNPQDPTNP